MNVLFEEDGSFKTGSVLTDNDSSLQVETASGKRVKLKATNVLLRFTAPAAGELLTRADTEAATLDTAFLWEMCGDDEFAFAEFAADYYGHTPGAVEAAAMLIALFGAPVYFHRKGRGRFRKAPEDILRAALAGLEKKRLQQEAVDRMKGELLAGTVPAEFAPVLAQLLYKPDRNRLETKALEAACEEAGASPAKLLMKAGALRSSYDYLYGRFLFEQFPQGTDFPAVAAPPAPPELPLAEVRAFSIDDATTTEIDDALSVTPRPEGGWRIGIHIAAPGLGITRGTPLDDIARTRLSTVYMPGNKLTMLPDEVVETFTLGAGQARPALSLYIDVNADYSTAGASTTRIERVPVMANLRHHDIEPLFNEDTIGVDGPDYPWRHELTLLWEWACVLEAGRGKPSANQHTHDYNYYVDWDVATPDGPGQVRIERRKRGSPLDKLVAELMILANSTWGKLLHEAGYPAIYRAQSQGRVRMTTAAAPHDGLGVDCYAWATSPLRRYVDLANQWQLLAWARGEAAPFPQGSVDLAAAMNDFDQTYTAYADFQRGMERYWCLRWLRQEGRKDVSARVVRENIVRLEDVPYLLKVHSLPNLHPGTRVQLSIESFDLLAAELRVKYAATLPPLDQVDADEDLDDTDLALPPEPAPEADKTDAAGTSGKEDSPPAS
ncbi:MAG: RNB domain-containing ribonuclease [Rhodocyclaceae bacterium]